MTGPTINSTTTQTYDNIENTSTTDTVNKINDTITLDTNDLIQQRIRQTHKSLEHLINIQKKLRTH